MAGSTENTRRGLALSWNKEGRRSPVAWLLFSLRLSIGWIFLWAGADKLYSKMTTGQSATAGYLQFATFGPFTGFFQALAGNAVVEGLVVWGLLLIGIALMLGAFTRVAAVSGALMMVLFYVSAMPPAHNPFMDDHLIYAILLGFLGVIGAGRFLGIDALVEKFRVVRTFPWVAAFLG